MAFPTKRTLTKSKVSVSENFVRTIRDETDEELAARQQLHNKYIDTYAEEKIFVLDSTVDTKHSSLDWTQVADSEKPLTDASAAEFKKYREDINQRNRS
jgi:hypothetical protein